MPWLIFLLGGATAIVVSASKKSSSGADAALVIGARGVESEFDILDISETSDAPLAVAESTFLAGAPQTPPTFGVLSAIAKAAPQSSCIRAIGSSKDFDRIAKHWPGLVHLRDWLAAHGVSVIIDIGPCGRRGEYQSKGSFFREPQQDSIALRCGEAVRFHPDMFARLTPNQTKPRMGESAKVHLGELGHWFVFSNQGRWSQVPIFESEEMGYEELRSIISREPAHRDIALSYCCSDRILQPIRVRHTNLRYPELTKNGPSVYGRMQNRKLFPTFDH